eukprot:3941947-Rhodomonas_salina.4
MDSLMGKCDPYCVVDFEEQIQKTSVQKGTYNASWHDEELRFFVEDAALEVGPMTIEVMDWDRMDKDDQVSSFYCKCLVLTCAVLLPGRKHRDPGRYNVCPGSVLPIVLRFRYAMSGTDVGYAATRSKRRPAGRERGPMKSRYQPTRVLGNVRY